MARQCTQVCWTGPISRLRIALALAALATGACGGSGPAVGNACGPDVTEPLDPGSVRHVLPGAPEPDYASDPPTSGAHLAGAPAGDVLRTPLPRPEQVGVLEEGGVLLQHRDLGDADQRRLEALAGDGVVVAPNPDLDAAVVATAWRQRLRCQQVEVATLRTFIALHRRTV
ncbi:MAG: DUF3105 domain-containing protein [Acidimicrobiales bacterium]